MAANTQRRGGSAINGRTTRHQSYSVSQRIGKRVEEIFGWMKTVGISKTRSRGAERTQLAAWWVGLRIILCASPSWRSKRCETGKQLLYQQRKIDSIEQAMLMISSSVFDCVSKFCLPSEISSFKVHFFSNLLEKQCQSNEQS